MNSTGSNNTNELATRIAELQLVTVEGEFFRHCGLKYRPLDATTSGGRWGEEGAYPVLYLGRPESSVIAEAYRWLVDDNPELEGWMVAPRQLVKCRVEVSNVLDLSVETNAEAVGLTEADLQSEVGNYEACRAIGRAAHQLGVHGVLAPAATGLGQTLALFSTMLPAEEYPTVVESVVLNGLPDDPRDQSRPRIKVSRDNSDPGESG